MHQVNPAFSTNRLSFLFSTSFHHTLILAFPNVLGMKWKRKRFFFLWPFYGLNKAMSRFWLNQYLDLAVIFRRETHTQLKKKQSYGYCGIFFNPKINGKRKIKKTDSPHPAQNMPCILRPYSTRSPSFLWLDLPPSSSSVTSQST